MSTRYTTRGKKVNECSSSYINSNCVKKKKLTKMVIQWFIGWFSN